MSVFQLAANMGISVEMLEDFYGSGCVTRRWRPRSRRMGNGSASCEKYGPDRRVLLGKIKAADEPCLMLKLPDGAKL
jgi:hypothetical protein